MTTWTGAQTRARRLERHHLMARNPGTAIAEVVAAMCGAHAQVMSAAQLSIGLRMDGVSRIDVRRALWVEHSLVKTFDPRGTVHLLPAPDLSVWTGALAAVPLGSSLPADVRLTNDQVDAVVAAIREALVGEQELTVDELGDVVVATTGAWAADLVVPAFTAMWPRRRQAPRAENRSAQDAS